MEKLGRGKGKMQAAQQPSHVPDIGPLLMRSYLDERRKRLLYSDRGLHVLVHSVTPLIRCVMRGCAFRSFIRKDAQGVAL